jgi:hypothetical protein
LYALLAEEESGKMTDIALVGLCEQRRYFSCSPVPSSTVPKERWLTCSRSSEERFSQEVSEKLFVSTRTREMVEGAARIEGAVGVIFLLFRLPDVEESAVEGAMVAGADFKRKASVLPTAHEERTLVTGVRGDLLRE